MDAEQMNRFADMVAERVLAGLREDSGATVVDAPGNGEAKVSSRVGKKRGKYEKWSEEANNELRKVHAKGGDEAVRELAARRKKSATGYLAQLHRILKNDADKKRIEELTA